jgi:hypothetical protein
MDIHMSEGGVTTAEKAHKREEFRLLMSDVQDLPETQRTALLLREIDALSYEQIAEAMDTTIPSVKSLLVRARVSLAEASEARAISCVEVRAELGEVAEGIKQRMSPPVRRHVRTCERCAGFRKQLRQTNKALAAVFPIGPLLFLKKSILAQLGTTASAGGAAAGATSAATSTAAAGGAASLASGVSAVATKAVAGLTAAAIVTAGAVEVQHSATHRLRPAAPVVAQTAPAPAETVEPVVVASVPQQAETAKEIKAPAIHKTADLEAVSEAAIKARATKTEVPPAQPAVTTPDEAAATTETVPPTPAPAPAEGSDTTTLPPADDANDDVSVPGDGSGQPPAEPQDGSGTATSDDAPPPTPTPAPAPAGGTPPPPPSDTAPPPAAIAPDPAS